MFPDPEALLLDLLNSQHLLFLNKQVETYICLSNHYLVPRYNVHHRRRLFGFLYRNSKMLISIGLQVENDQYSHRALLLH